MESSKVEKITEEVDILSKRKTPFKLRLRLKIRKILTYFRLLTAANPSKKDVVLLIVGTICAVASGVPFPILGIVFGQLIDNLNSATCTTEQSGDASFYQTDINRKVLLVLILGVAQFVLMITHLSCWTLFGTRLSHRLRDKYMEHLLKQNISFFDTLPAGAVSSRLNVDISTIRSGTAEKVGICISSASFFVTAYIVAFVKEPRLTGILVSLIPAYFAMMLGGSFFIDKYSSLMSSAFAVASNIACNALENISVVHAFNASRRLETKFSSQLLTYRSKGIQKAISTGIQSGLLYFVAYSANGLAFWQGARSIAGSVEKGGEVSTVGAYYTVIFLLVEATLAFSAVAPLLQMFGAATGAFQLVEEEMSSNDNVIKSSRSGHFPNLDGHIKLKNVSFAYASRPESTVVHDVSIVIPNGKRTAIVGASGSGKSTLSSLISCLHEPNQGEILFDGHDARGINLKHLRSYIGLIQQDPALLEVSILENIAFGLLSSPAHSHLHPFLLDDTLTLMTKTLSENANQRLDAVAQQYGPHCVEILELVKHAATQADAATFIEATIHGYCTIIGSGASQLSGGQQQRLALARALVKSPKILILDEATSALDSSSEKKIMEVVDRLTDTTIIIIAHRLSILKTVDSIIVMKEGRAIETGSYSTLTEADGTFAKLAGLQDLAFEKSLPNNLGLEASGKDQLIHAEIDRHKSQANSLRPSLVSKDTTNRCETAEPRLAKTQSLVHITKGIIPLLRRDGPLALLAVFGATIVGGAFSAESVIFGHTVASLSPCNTPLNIKTSGNFFGLMFFVLAIIEFFANIVSWSGFGIIAEKLLFNVRVLSLRSLLAKEMNWHHSNGRAPSKLLSIITKDGGSIAAVSGSIIGTMVSILINLIGAIILTHIVAWRIALVCVSTVPLLLGAGIMEMRVLAKSEEKHETAYVTSDSIAVEAISCIKTISSYALEEKTLNRFRHSLAQPRKEVTSVSLQASFWLASTYFIGNLSYALAFWWGSKQIIAGNYNQTQFLIVVMSLLVSAQLWTQMFVLAPELSSARAAAGRILNLIDGKIGKSIPLPSQDYDSHGVDSFKKQDIESEAGSTLGLTAPLSKGTSIKFDRVSFSYTDKPTAKVLTDLTFEIRAGQFAAFVGASGAGKTTIISLLERLYRPQSGAILVDGRDITKTDNSSFRDDMSLVPQNSALFEGSVRFNVGLGARPNHEATENEIINACKLANIHETIVGLASGYDTECGSNGNQISGGQRQRVAIARALVRQPRLLILDESTSALDAESEQLVQEGLQKVSANITVVAIAHRLSTIRRADVIFVIDHGNLVDQGTHEELLIRCEAYRNNALHQMT